MNCPRSLAIAMIVVPLVWAQEQEPAEPAPRASDRRPHLTVAILDFDAQDPGQPELGQHISSTLTALLSGERGFELVERATLTRTLQEHELNLSGLVEADQALRVGRLVGARILVTGRAFRLGNNLYITAKVIGTETSLVDGVLVNGKLIRASTGW